ncbi:hypothetical protein TWF225_009373 [Orbilia oligospora]|uniref:Uncharacterized protein n=1 Tax=Orbilia oligospora TaxID=2813651 RepID=A0A7C8U3S1_ORBOL|nr:hypothetical protein TWF751_001946 [Orbilia oligospora]KAF3193830.1 hypothetical protein TWF225_009373 [Orbilia oligospora]KAF3270015.1 hypothetical protein TWF217_008358 [Orbilia oligospora]KAF3270481.1 hypothetical protein TWF128_004248 [Orbilia oligospora]KAF3298034.1 hypothetical protein TWF132_004176 [Orbilia oligospora]
MGNRLSRPAVSNGQKILWASATGWLKSDQKRALAITSTLYAVDLRYWEHQAGMKWERNTWNWDKSGASGLWEKFLLKERPGTCGANDTWSPTEKVCVALY